METAYDWVTLAIFAGLVTQFLVRSAEPEDSGDRLWQYLVPSAGCAIANWAGNHGYHLVAIPLILLVLAWIYRVLLRRDTSSSGH